MPAPPPAPQPPNLATPRLPPPGLSPTARPLSSPAEASRHAPPVHHRCPNARTPASPRNPHRGLALVSAPPLGTSPCRPGSTPDRSSHAAVPSLLPPGTVPRFVSLADNLVPVTPRLRAIATCAPSPAPLLPPHSPLSSSTPFSPIPVPPPPTTPQP